MKQIVLTQGRMTAVDDSDFDRLHKHRWFYAARHDGRATGYAIRHIRLSKTRVKVVRLHREVIGDPPHGMNIDHIDGDTLNNRRSNLRFATSSQNLANSPLRRDNITGAKGVHWHKGRQRYTASIGFNGKRIWLGAFGTVKQASRAYAEASIELYGSFSRVS